MKLGLRIAILLTTFVIKANSWAQQTIVRGIVKDTVNNYSLSSATVSIYKDSNLVAYQLTNSYGAFSFKNLPSNSPLKIVTSHTGYRIFQKRFVVDKNDIDLQIIPMHPSTTVLDEVTISASPVVMNGDTLEFNASAFKLDSNAVVEDLMRKIDNITLWGDGKITVNGREVKRLLVNGKVFFGGDTKVATQNLPNNTLEKIQVYKLNDNNKNQLDSSLAMNLKLKKGMEKGYFGKIGLGFGSNQRYEGDANLNLFSPKLQLSLVGAKNNINKMGASVNVLLRNSTFKGVGANVDYMPDFLLPGINKTSSTGGSFKYTIKGNDEIVLKADYFLQYKDNSNLSSKKTTTELGELNRIVENNEINNKAQSTIQTFNQALSWKLKKGSFNLSQSVSLKNTENENNIVRSASNQDDQLRSINKSLRQGSLEEKVYVLMSSYKHLQGSSTRKIYEGVLINYKFTTINGTRYQNDRSDYFSLVDPHLSRRLDRQFKGKTNNTTGQIELELPNIKNVVFGNNYLGGIALLLRNKFSANIIQDHNIVNDLDTIINDYKRNTYLTNNSIYREFNDVPSILITKAYVRQLTNRFNKTLEFSLEPRAQIIQQNNKSDRVFQNINRSYFSFALGANVFYKYNRFGRFYRSYSLSFNRDMLIPTIEQIAPLTDSTNLYNLRKGNDKLLASFKNEIGFDFSNTSEKKKNPISYKIGLRLGNINRKFTDSVFIDNQNIRTIYTINADGYLDLDGFIEKPFKFAKSELQFTLGSSAGVSKVPGFINSQIFLTNFLSTNHFVKLNYTFRDIIAVNLGEIISTSVSNLKKLNDITFRNFNAKTTLSTSFKLAKKVTFNTNVNFNSFSSTGTKTINYTIWNAILIYRMLKENNAEIKFSALDLLHQNNNIILNTLTNSQTIGRQNVLQRYFMLTISYYPRQFGVKWK